MPITRLLFPSTRMAIRADALLTTKQIAHTILPVPSHLSAECGMSILINNNSDTATLILTADNIQFTAIEEKQELTNK